MGGPPVSEEVRRIVVQQWRNMTFRDIHTTAKEVYYAVKSQLQADPNNRYRPPSLRTVQEIIRQARKRRASLPYSESSLDKPWSIATLNEHELPAESIPRVLQVWRYSLNIEKEFTIRQAKWVSRLYVQVPDITELWYQSLRYAEQEELSLLSGEPMNTYYIDSTLIMSFWESKLAMYTGSMDNVPFGYAFLEIPYSKDGGIAEELIHAISDKGPGHIEGSEGYERNNQLLDLLTELPSASKYFDSFESRMVYLKLLSLMARGSKWSQLEPGEIRDLIIELRNWVKEREYRIISTESGVEDISFPSKLFSRTGYPTGEDMEFNGIVFKE